MTVRMFDIDLTHRGIIEIGQMSTWQLMLSRGRIFMEFDKNNNLDNKK